MSTLTKVFIILVFFITLFMGAVISVYFSQRIDWKDKYLKETQSHQSTIQYFAVEKGVLLQKNKELKDKIESLTTINNRLEAEIAQKTRDIESISAEVARLHTLIEYLKGELKRVNQMLKTSDEQLATVLEQMGKLRTDVQAARDRERAAEQYRLAAEAEVRTLSKYLSELEAKYIDVVRELTDLKKKIPAGIVKPLPKPVNTKVMAVSMTDKLVILGAGEKQGVKVGDEFTIYREGKFVACVQVCSVRAEASACTILYTSDELVPDVGDDASTSMITPIAEKK
jgi:predicted  nucleic acid-binding Zn-ribbon protein